MHAACYLECYLACYLACYLRWQEGKMSEARKEKKKAEELARRREQEARQHRPEAPAPAQFLGSAPARRLPLGSLHLAAPGQLGTPRKRGRPPERPATASAARASRLPSRPFRTLRDRHVA